MAPNDQTLGFAAPGTAGGRAGVTFLEDLAATAHLAAGAAGEGAVLEVRGLRAEVWG